MKKYYLLCSFLLFVFYFNTTAFSANKEFIFCGGPSGGTFMYFANGVSKLAEKYGMKVTALPTKGSIDNIRLLQTGEANFAIAYASDAALARNGLLKGDTTKYDKILGAGVLYSGKIHIVVKKDSGIKSFKDLAGKKVAVGEAGTGAASSAQRILSSMGLWNKISRYYIGYRKAENAFKSGMVDAVWVFAGIPNSSVSEMMVDNKATLLNMQPDINSVLKVSNSYRMVKIPKGTYNSVDTNITTVEADAVLLTNLFTSEKDVNRMMEILYTPESIRYMSTQHPAAVEIHLEPDMSKMMVPPHPGAIRFWREKRMAR
jgi:TRAP transporter TAXI family solute receptor